MCNNYSAVSFSKKWPKLEELCYMWNDEKTLFSLLLERNYFPVFNCACVSVCNFPVVFFFFFFSCSFFFFACFKNKNKIKHKHPRKTDAIYSSLHVDPSSGSHV